MGNSERGAWKSMIAAMRGDQPGRDPVVQVGSDIPPAERREEAVDVRRDLSDASLKRITSLQLIYSLAGLLVGVACVFGGMALFFRGVTGSTDWTLKLLGVNSKLVAAAPGVILFVVGLLVVYLTRFVIRIRK